MRLTNPVVFGLVSLVCSVNATKANGKPVLAKRQAMVTVTHNGCTAICVDYGKDLGTECDVLCDEASSSKEPATSAYNFPHTLTSTLRATATLKSNTPLNESTVVSTSNGPCGTACTYNLAEDRYDCYTQCDTMYMTMPTKSTHTSTSTLRATVTSNTKPPLNQSTVVSTSNNACHQTCSVNKAEGDIDCYFTCDVGFSKRMLPTPTSDAALHQRTVVSATQDDCTAVCWDLMPGTECDVQCSSEFKTDMPGNISQISGTHDFNRLVLIPEARVLLEPISLMHLTTCADKSSQYSEKPLISPVLRLVRYFKVCLSLPPAMNNY